MSNIGDFSPLLVDTAQHSRMKRSKNEEKTYKKIQIQKIQPKFRKEKKGQ